MKKITKTLLNVQRCASGSTTPWGSFVGLNNAKKATIFLEGSNEGCTQGTVVLNVYPTIAFSLGSIDTVPIGSIVIKFRGEPLGRGAWSTFRRTIEKIGSSEIANLKGLICNGQYTSVGAFVKIKAYAVIQTE